MYIPQIESGHTRHTDWQRIIVRIFLFLNLLLALAYFSTAQAAERRYQFDPSHTSILFMIDHLGYSRMVGEFHRYEGYFIFDDQVPEQGRVEITIYPASVDTDVEELDKKLQGPTLFNTKDYPEAVFKSTSIKVTGQNTAVVSGNFTMLGVTKPMDLEVTYNKGGKHPFAPGYVAGFSVKGHLFRSAFNMTEGLPLVGDRVDLWIETEGNAADEAAPEAK